MHDCILRLWGHSNRESPFRTYRKSFIPLVAVLHGGYRVPLADKYAGHEECFGNDICFRIECSPSHCAETPFSVSVPFSNSRLLVLALPPLTHRTWYMKHIALPSDGMTLTQPPSREIMPRDPVTPDHVIFLPLLPIWITLSLQPSFVRVSIISVHRQM